jgi:type I restriction enzyme, S subunit
MPGDVLFSITAYLGSVAVVPDDLEPAYVSHNMWP